MLTPPVTPAFEKNNIAIALVSSDFYAPYTAVTIKSIIDHASSDKNYDIIILSLDMTEEHEQVLSSMSDGNNNISIRLVCPEEIYNKNFTEQHFSEDQRFGGLTILRILFPLIFESYNKIISIEGDMIICDDIAGLYEYNLDDYYAGAVFDLIVACNYFYYESAKKAIAQTEVLTPENYFNGGVVVLNLKNIRKDLIPQNMIKFIIDNQCRFFEQDAFNHFFRNHWLRIDISWNFPVDSKGFIRRGHKHLNSQFYYEYLESSKHPKIIHYLTPLKPWHSVLIPYASKWWNTAVETPLFEKILSRREDEKKSTKPKYLLFICETVFQLMTAINIKFHLYPDTDADLALTMTTDFSRYIDSLNQIRIFKNIYVSKYCQQKNHTEIINAAPNRDLMKNPEKYEYSMPLKHPYSDYFMPVCSSTYQKIIYYQIVNLGTPPYVHIFDEGSNTYIDNISNICRKDALDHTIYQESDRFINNISEILLYEPELYSGGEKRFFSVIPKIKDSDIKFANLLKAIFGECIMPKEKYIFFNECFAIEKKVSNDIQILDSIAQKVGKENITVKLHPRASYGEELYQLHGYSIFAESTVPWEMFVLSANIENKVLISVSSNTLINPHIVFDKKVRALYLWKVMQFSRRVHVKNPSYKRFFDKVKRKINVEETRLFCPTTISELDVLIDYLEGTI